MLTRLFKQPVLAVTPGRWARYTNPNLTFKKVDWANEDHCGTCSISVTPQTPPRHTMSDDLILELMGCFTEVPTPKKL